MKTFLKIIEISTNKFSYILNPALANSISNVSDNDGMVAPKPTRHFFLDPIVPHMDTILLFFYSSASFSFNHPKWLGGIGKKDLASDADSHTHSSTQPVVPTTTLLQ